MKSQDSKLSKIHVTKVLEGQPAGNSCQFYDKAYGSVAGLRGHEIEWGQYRLKRPLIHLLLMQWWQQGYICPKSHILLKVLLANRGDGFLLLCSGNH